MPREYISAPTAPPAPGTVPGVVSRLDGNGGERLRGLEASLQRCKAELEELNEVQRERKGRDPRKHVKLLAIEDTRRQKEMVEARMVTLQGKIDKLTPPLPHTPPSPTVTRALGYPEVWGDRTTWIDGAWPAEVPDPDPNPDPNPETVMTCCTCTSQPVHKQPASVQVRVQSPAQDIEDIEDLFQGEVGYEVQTCAEILLSLQANTPPALPVQRVTSTGSMATPPQPAPPGW